ncbi:hypothetical protein ACQ5SK_45415 [Bradyrhizobium japonicum]
MMRVLAALALAPLAIALAYAGGWLWRFSSRWCRSDCLRNG